MNSDKPMERIFMDVNKAKDYLEGWLETHPDSAMTLEEAYELAIESEEQE
jgi:hypothetical protein